jgi:hypothetical protein
MESTMKRILATAATAALALTLTAGPAAARPELPRGGGDGACVAAGTQTLKGDIGGAASGLGGLAVAGVILAHTNGDDPLTGACS